MSKYLYEVFVSTSKLSMFVNTADCKSLALGMENGSIPDSSITASGYSPGFEPRNARLNNPTSCWKLKVGDGYIGEISLTIELKKVTTVTRISIQGDPTEDCWVTQFWLEYLDSNQQKWVYKKDGKLVVRGFEVTTPTYLSLSFTLLLTMGYSVVWS